MKTPREILLHRHRPVEARLDAVRNEVVTKHLRSDASEPVPSKSAAMVALLWRELVWPCRHAWLALAAVWVLIVVLNATTTEGTPQIANRAPATVGQSLMALSQRNLLKEELIEPTKAPPSAPPPRSQRRSRTLAG